MDTDFINTLSVKGLNIIPRKKYTIRSFGRILTLIRAPNVLIIMVIR